MFSHFGATSVVNVQQRKEVSVYSDVIGEVMREDVRWLPPTIYPFLWTKITIGYYLYLYNVSHRLLLFALVTITEHVPCTTIRAILHRKTRIQSYNTVQLLFAVGKHCGSMDGRMGGL